MLTKSRNVEDLKKILPAKNVLLSREERYIYAQDSTNTRRSKQLPDVVVFPESIEEVQAIVRYANKHRIPLKFQELNFHHKMSQIHTASD